MLAAVRTDSQQQAPASQESTAHSNADIGWLPKQTYEHKRARPLTSLRSRRPLPLHRVGTHSPTPTAVIQTRSSGDRERLITNHLASTLLDCPTANGRESTRSQPHIRQAPQNEASGTINFDLEAKHMRALCWHGKGTSASIRSLTRPFNIRAMPSSG
jgi:hypothetical protein